MSQDSVVTRGNYLLREVLLGYETRIERFEQSNSNNADVQFISKEIRVKRGYFTINFPNPEPIYKMMMDVEVYKYGELLGKATVKTRSNMSAVNFLDHPFIWMYSSEIKNPEYQFATFETGLAKLCQKLYFDYLDISLNL